MIGLRAVTRLLEEADQAPLSVRAERCLNGRYKDVCHRCLEVCSSSALALSPMVELRAEACTACGACWRVCPTEALTLRDVDDARLTHNMGRLLEATSQVELACRRGRERGVGTGAPVLELGCLGWLSPALLIWGVAQGAERIWINDAPCPSCERLPARQATQRAIDAARGLLTAFGREDVIRCYGESPHSFLQPAPSCPSAVVRAGEVQLSRRDLFASWSNSFRRSAPSLAGSWTEGSAIASTTPYAPLRNVYLVQALRRLGKPGTDMIDATRLCMAQVVIEGGCSGCGLCCRICPSGALNLENQGNYAVITFCAAACGACGLCQRICPPGVLSLGGGVALASLVQGCRDELKRVEMGRCDQCQEPIPARSGDSLCSICAATMARRRAIASLS